MKEQTSDHLFASIFFIISVLINIRMIGVIIMLSMIMHFLIHMHYNKESTDNTQQKTRRSPTKRWRV